MAGNDVIFTTPVGRLVYGSLYKPREKDSTGKPLVVKNGPNAGKPRVEYGFGLAIAKGAPGEHWGNTEWGRVLWQLGHTAFPNHASHPTFAWKIIDGDDTKPNKNNKRPCDQTGFAGHWILKFSSSYAPGIYKLRDGTRDQFDPFQIEGAIKNGYYVQVNVAAKSNESRDTPGIHLNPRMVCFAGYGDEIVSGPDVASAGFGLAPLPAGASLAPPAGAFNTNSVAAPPAGNMPTPPGAGMAPLVPTPPGAGMAVVAPPGAAAVAPPASIVMNPNSPYTLEALRAQQWTDDQIIAAGYATRPATVAAVTPMAPGAAPLPPGFSAPAGSAPAAQIAPVAPVTPNVGFANGPGGMPPPPGAAAAAPARRLVMTATAQGTYEAYKASNWSDEQLVGAGVAQWV